MLFSIAVGLTVAAPELCHAEHPRTCEHRVSLQTAGARGVTDPLGRGAWLIDEELDEVLLADASGVRRRVPVGAWPEQLVVDSGGRVYVSCREAGRVDVVDPDFGVRSIPVGPEPRALALDEAHHQLFVGTATGKQLVAFDTLTLEPLNARDTPQPPISLALTALGLAVVSDRSPELLVYPRDLRGEPLRVALVTAAGGLPGLLRIDEPDRQISPSWLVNDSDDLLVVSRAIATGLESPSAEGGYGGGVGAPHQLIVHRVSRLSLGLSAAVPVADPFLPEASSAVLHQRRLILSSRTRSLMALVDLERPEREFALPIEPTEPRSRALHFRSRMVARSVDSHSVSSAASLEDGRLLALEPGPRQLRLAWSQAHRGRARLVGVTVARLAPSAIDAELRLGRALFHDAQNDRVSTRGMSCAHCHPDGREDGLVWEQDATFRQTPMLAGGRLADTAPYNWQGTARTLEANIHQTIEHRLDGNGLRSTELKALARYVREGLRPVHRPAPRAAHLLAQGRDLFQSARAGCASCHPADFAFTDGASHNVRSVGALERQTFEDVHGPPTQLIGFSDRFFQRIRRGPGSALPRRFNTPGLAFLGLTAPYLHDGSARTLDELVQQNHDRMGTTSHLSGEERQALVAYLESL